MRRQIQIGCVSFLLLFSGWLQAQTVKISGKVSGFEPGSLVRVRVYADQFSRLKKTMAAVRTDSAGFFELSFPLKKTTFALLDVNLKQTSFYLQPGAVYHFQITQDSAARQFHSFYAPLQATFQASDDSLNAFIERYDDLFSQFINRHFRDVYQFHNRQIFNQFKQQVKARFSQVENPYVKQYIHYSLASMEWGGRMRSLPEIVQNEFAGHPVLYNNIQYTNFFTDFFQAYFQSTVKKPVTLDKLQQLIPEHNLQKLDALYAQAPALNSDRRVRELAEMVQWASLYHRPGFDPSDIDALFRQMAIKSPFAENRKIAEDYRVKLRQMQPGTPAPAFRLPDFTGKEFSLKDFRGKFVLISFIGTHCPVCNFQLNQLKSLQQNLIDFTNLTIVSGKVTSDFIQNARPLQRQWPFLLLGKDILLLEKYQIVNYPAYVLIGPAGRIIMAPAPMPDENLEQRIHSVINAYKKRLQN